jgi:cell division protease FtsH
MEKLKAMAESLMQYETLDAEQVKRIMQGLDPGQPESWSQNRPSPPPTRGGGVTPGVVGAAKPAGQV